MSKTETHREKRTEKFLKICPFVCWRRNEGIGENRILENGCETALHYLTGNATRFFVQNFVLFSLLLG